MIEEPYLVIGFHHLQQKLNDYDGEDEVTIELVSMVNNCSTNRMLYHRRICYRNNSMDNHNCIQHERDWIERSKAVAS